MLMRSKCVWISLFLLSCSLASPGRAQSAAAAARLPTTAERLAAQRASYDALQKDPTFKDFQRQFEAGTGPELLERYLTYLPISPLDYLEIDMQARHYEIAVPKPVYDEHVRWVQLHAERARELYGDVVVDSLLTGWPVDTSVAERQTLATRDAVSNNENVASGGVPAPTEYQGEIQLAVNHNNVNQIVAAANTWDGMSGSCANGIQAVFFSSDGGATWGYTCPPGPTAYSGFPSCSGIVFGSDPAVFWNDSNQVFLNYMLICRTGGVNKTSMVVARSDNGGASWSAQGVIKNSWSTGTFEDKNFYVVDNTPTSPYYGRHYTCWDRDNNEKMAYSTNNGASWTEVDLPTAASGSLDLGCDLAVQKNGTLHIVFDTLDCGVSSCSNERMFYTRSTNGGVSWSTPVLVRDFNLVAFSGSNFPDAQDTRGIGPFGAVDVDNSGGSCDGRLYVTYTDIPTGGTVNDAEVYVAYSTNNGTTWTSPAKVNDDLLNGRAQFNTTLRVDQSSGDVVVAWHDARHDSGNDSIQAYVARSLDCGASFEANTQVTKVSLDFNNWTWSFSNENTADNPNRNPNQFGEYMGLDVHAGKAYLAWMDTREFYPNYTTDPEKENLGFAVVDFSTGPYKKNFKSLYEQDGWVYESGETTNVGGGANSTTSGAWGLKAGDTLADTQLKAVVSFDTSTIPDAATIQAAKLRLKRGGVIGTNPFSILGNLTADVKNGYFNNAWPLEAADFQAAATATAVCNFSSPAADGDWAECTFSSAGKSAINKGGRTQVRVYFTLDDNDDLGSDYMGFYSADTWFADDMPVLEVTYQ